MPEITLSEQNIRTDNDTIPAHTLVSTITHPIQGDNLSLTLTGTDLLTLVGDSLRVAEDLDVSQGGKSFRITIRVVNNTDTLRTETFLITIAKNNYGNPHDSQTLLGESLNEQQGKAVALSANGRRMVIGTDAYDNSPRQGAGHGTKYRYQSMDTNGRLPHGEKFLRPFWWSGRHQPRGQPNRHRRRQCDGRNQQTRCRVHLPMGE